MWLSSIWWPLEELQLMFGCVNRASDTLIDDLEKKDFYCRKICVSDELKRLYEVSFVEKCKKCVQHIVPYCATLWSVCVWTSSSAGSDWHTHSARSDESVCWCTVFTLNILYSLCVFFRVWMCACRTFVTVCHSMWIEATSVLVCVCATAREKKRSVKNPTV